MRSFIRLVDQKGLSILILILSDALWYFLSFILAYFIRAEIGIKFYGLTYLQPFDIYFKVIPFVLILIVIVFYFYGLYEKQNRVTALNEITLIIKATTFCLLLIMSASFLRKYDYSRILILLFWVLSIFFMNLGRFFLRKIQRYLYKKGYAVKNVLIVGAGKIGKQIANSLEHYSDFGYKIIGFIDDKTKIKNDKYQFFGGLKQLMDIVKRKHIQYVYIADPSISHENILNMMHECENLNVRFKIVSNLFEIVAGGIDINEIEGIPTIDLSKNHERPIYDFFKRFVDLFLSIFGIIISTPFWLLITILIKLETKGHAIFIQERVGKNGKFFKMYKFRTMYKNTDENTYAPKNPNDKRITKVGKFLRKTSLDELPQLINVIKGDMSLVGPRPEMCFIVAKYKEWQKKRLDVKPGITGLWQVLGRKDLPLHENLEYDFYYIKNRSMLLDIVILLKTVSAVIFQRGAY
ncbi:MAG: hypothetical protein UR28_C0004G0007 [Candidatus Peregrinibacteria bacterium GW2011_GWF2_33_10]|nr:MAG: hypothetical protein UR28_C0004G0007 [Candidatus Peregrinibacteria bacterium GW2011_GWF2_33_10]OGJ44130.1 MAG: hypothetical protein A2263_01770 [Candidatus Peregrinibacteria bacterium RIFOXYA2_FULL_33_21]OGJ47475.1 MAG: hypothetical protein A2272_06065 [Candidatus Peregrinibacteria bacterium RIFOXYA12_FULL_33_12]OGJ49968.1 MAG: hypothetical protein A2307_03750 [Candidatus Peregrinibacteria bacterium RIFOXYB2_FULL_33_20]